MRIYAMYDFSIERETGHITAKRCIRLFTGKVFLLLPGKPLEITRHALNTEELLVICLTLYS